MAGLISAFVELPGASNHEDFKFPWSLDDINHLVSDRKGTRSRQKNKYTNDVQNSFAEPTFLEDYGKPTAAGPSLAGNPEPNYPQAPRPSAVNPQPGGPTDAQANGLKKSLKYVTGLVKQKIVSLEEKAASYNFNENPNMAGQTNRSPAPSPDLTQGRNTTDRMPTSHTQMNEFSEEDELDAKGHHSQRKKQILETRPVRFENQEAYQSKQGNSTGPPRYYQNLDESCTPDVRRSPAKKEVQAVFETSSSRRKGSTKLKQTEAQRAGANVRGSSSTKLEDPSKMERTSASRLSNGIGPKVQIAESKAKIPTLVHNDLQIHGDENLLCTLKRFKTIFLLDDSASMASNGNWAEGIRVLAELVKEALLYDTEGIELKFLNSESHFKSLKSASSLIRKLKTIQPTGDSTPTETKVEEILRPYIQVLEAQKSRQRPLPKPLNLVIITDGIPDDIDSFISIIRLVSSKLDAGHFPLNQIGIQFVQIGAEKQVSRVLKFLDNHLQKRYGISRDMIDTTQFTGLIDKAFVIKCLLGGINRRIDRMQTSS
ncbi:hypothetical protein Pst134EA_027086 [Puccinia striiformis f. sp. tritici]|uniref:VWFA domain-containing protein n=3 Tax=Puccinia striiformis TaxID=27350 RepID=A0A0L0VTD7_9BASI|nr:hypothetical protein Pst134EA_027086 [Puccinia striiformis f. sp. tritici]KAI9625835.1 hypothetical protein H4Q26_016083 [Puccinia striiformis f. sp. tritici PST-130]KNF02290.1 hypothetical protein PSTG_04498 [Puccinia striiformis f. sp. tritici PST-78]POW00728.1 hypothetical protein PSHT_12883 [Puccinia striiformis]KAH9443274.1 hypothetical protein Pst134EB_027622 [Puccinia striiformis f. sp. tritici]KAH9450383.1 hypothetical protein Pst134EA_027086 [Puccinia striiformis f. sp. tritici]